MKNADEMRILIVVGLLLIILAGTGTAATLSNSGGGTWKYQREIIINENSGETLTDYQVLIKLEGEDFPVEAQSDGADIRFTDENGAELGYWIEEFNSGSKSAKVWVKVLKIPASGKARIRMWWESCYIHNRKHKLLTILSF